MEGRKSIEVSEYEIKEMLAEKYEASIEDIHLLHYEYEVSGLSGHSITTTGYKAKILID